NWMGSVIFTTQSIDHIALSSEQYTVTVSDNYGCSATITPVLTALPPTNIVGTITYTGGGLASGNVYLIKIGTSSADYDTVSVATVFSGNFTFLAPNAGNYYARAEAGGAYPTLVNTYFGNHYLWDSALAVPHGCSVDDSANIIMQEILPVIGPGSIHGTVYEGMGFGQKLILGPVGVMTNVIPGVPVKVGKNPGGSIVATTLTDTSGQYDFTNLPYDSYKIYTDIPGYPMDSSYAVVLSASTDSLINLDYFVDSNSVYIDLTTQIHSIEKNNSSTTVFPNPAKDNVTFVFEVKENSLVNMELYNLQGEKINVILNRNFEKGKVTQTINLDQYNITSGTYMIKANINNNNSFIKLVVIK
ncbi:MAG: carboxypeptidase regulatory-like domain-containing protein, partial [Bacteroidia bacterium]|nr:carboxypeptidase regulatory-like domain-containing protein [Bacteroidia bacterium]